MFKIKIRALRESSNMSQDQLANLLGVERSTYTGYETGKSKPSAQKIKNIARIHCVTVDSLLDDSIPVEKMEILPRHLQVSENQMKYDPEKTIKVTLANLSSDEQMLVSSFRLLSDSDKQKLLFDVEEKSHNVLF